MQKQMPSQNQPMVWLVFKGLNGDFKWDEKFVVGSMEEFVELRNKGAKAIGAKRDIARLDSPNQITEVSWDGNIRGTYHRCEADVHALI